MISMELSRSSRRAAFRSIHRRLISDGCGEKPTCVTPMVTSFAFSAPAKTADTHRGEFQSEETQVHSDDRLEGAVNGLYVRAAGAGRQFEPATLDERFSAACQLHR